MESITVGALREAEENGAMSDILMLATGLGFFALFVLYGLTCERL